MTFCGSRLYMAPEMTDEYNFQSLSRGKTIVKYNAKVDAWSFGMTFLHCFIGLGTDIFKYKAKLDECILNERLRHIIKNLLQENHKQRGFLHELWQQTEEQHTYDEIDTASSVRMTRASSSSPSSTLKRKANHHWFSGLFRPKKTQ